MRPWTLVTMLLVTSLAGCASIAPEPATEARHPLAGSTFHWSPGFPEAGETVTFEAQPRTSASNDQLIGILWDFGSDSAQGWTPQHIFATEGERTVSMTVQSAKGGYHTIRQNITILPGEPIIEEPEAPPAPGKPTIHTFIAGTDVTFSFTWDRQADQIYWDFGDGKTSKASAPMHRYAPGNHSALLRVAAGGVIEEATAVVRIDAPIGDDGEPIVLPEREPRVIVGVTDSGINPYHSVYYREHLTEHPCTYVEGYDDCSIPALHLSVGPSAGTYSERIQQDQGEWGRVRPGEWFWVPQTNLIGIHCPSGGQTQGGQCILDDESNHGTGTTSNVLTEAPDALMVFNEGSSSQQLATSPVAIDIESNSWGSLAPLYGGFVNGPTGSQVCHDSIDSPTSLKFRSAGNNGPVPNMGDCWRNGYRSYSVSGGYPDGTHGSLSGSAPDFASYWCRPVASTHSIDGWGSNCGTSFAAPTAAGTAAAALLEIRRELGFVGGSTLDEVAPGITHEAFMDAVIMAATYEPKPRDGFPNGDATRTATNPTQWYWWGWGWLDAQVTDQIVDCAMGRPCLDNKSEEAWAFNDLRRSFASDGEP